MFSKTANDGESKSEGRKQTYEQTEERNRTTASLEHSLLPTKQLRSDQSLKWLLFTISFYFVVLFCSRSRKNRRIWKNTTLELCMCVYEWISLWIDLMAVGERSELCTMRVSERADSGSDSEWISVNESSGLTTKSKQ